MGKYEQPLITILIITYNSAKYIIETLESAKAQIYQNIELIISDDCSTDNTIEICNEWIDQNKGRFVRTEIITTPKNTGIAANCNRGLAVAKGVWVKYIAGDDTLAPTCIFDFISFVNSKEEEVVAVYGNMKLYNNTMVPSSFLQLKDYSNDLFNRAKITAAEQYQLVLRRVWIGAPSTFLKRELLNNMGGWDEEMPYEDWPMFIKINAEGYKIHYINKVVVNYRIHSKSIYNSSERVNVIFNEFFRKDIIVYRKYRKEHLTRIEQIIEEFEFGRKKLFVFLGLNRGNRINRSINLFFIKANNYLKRGYIRRIRVQVEKL